MPGNSWKLTLGGPRDSTERWLQQQKEEAMRQEPWASGVDGQSLATCLLSFNGGKVTVSTCMSKKPPGPGPDGLKKVYSNVLHPVKQISLRKKIVHVRNTSKLSHWQKVSCTVAIQDLCKVQFLVHLMKDIHRKCCMS